MLSIIERSKFKGLKKGFTLIELIIVIAMLGILLSISVPAFSGVKEKANERVCSVNCLQLEKMYVIYLEMKALQHSDMVFGEYLINFKSNVCPESGSITYDKEHVKCSIHNSLDDDNGNDGDDEVPYL